MTELQARKTLAELSVTRSNCIVISVMKIDRALIELANTHGGIIPAVPGCPQINMAHVAFSKRNSGNILKHPSIKIIISYKHHDDQILKERERHSQTENDF